jgi:alpha-L-fucosidase
LARRSFWNVIHWGPSSILAKEISWSRQGSKLGRLRYGGSGVNGEYKVDLEYDTLYKRFDPVEFDAETWVKIAKDAGMRYIVLTAKHHDGFCLFDSKVTDYDIMSTPYGKDICKQLADACHKNGVKLGWYYSPRDWYHRDFGGDNHEKYMDFEMIQLEELLTNYGKVDILWFDGLDSPQYLWKNFPEESFRKIRQWQPEIIINNRGGLRGDYDTPEQTIGAFERQHPWETCATIGNGWSWQGKNMAKPLDWCINTLIQTSSRDGNLLLNVSPQPDGIIPSQQVDRLNEIGQWISKYQEAIYGSRGGPFIATGNISSTCKDDKIFLHFTDEEPTIHLPDFGYKILDSRLLNGGKTTFKSTNTGWKVSIQKAREDENNLIVELTIEGNAFDINPLSL